MICLSDQNITQLDCGSSSTTTWLGSLLNLFCRSWYPLKFILTLLSLAPYKGWVASIELKGPSFTLVRLLKTPGANYSVWDRLIALFCNTARSKRSSLSSLSADSTLIKDYSLLPLLSMERTMLFLILSFSIFLDSFSNFCLCFIALTLNSFDDGFGRF